MNNKIKLNRFKIYCFAILIICFNLLLACNNHKIKSKNVFLIQFDINFNNLCKKEKINNNWDQSDRKIRLLLKEYEPKFSSEMSEIEREEIWIKSLIYFHRRFGNQLFKRFSKTDDIILMIRKKIIENKIEISESTKRALQNCSHLKDNYTSETISELEKIIFEK
jgi:hypothetical protein